MSVGFRRWTVGIARRGRQPGGRPLVGLDVGTSAVKAAELHRVNGAYRVRSMGEEALPPGTIAHDVVSNAGALAVCVDRLLRRLRITQRAVAVALAGHGVVVKRVSLPPMTAREVRGSMAWQVRQQIPIPVSDLYVDYHVDSPTGVGRSGKLRSFSALLVAAKKELVDAYVEALSRADCVTYVVDLEAFALQNVYEANDDGHLRQGTLVANVGAAHLNLNVVRNGGSRFVRLVPLSRNDGVDVAEPAERFTARVVDAIGDAVDHCRSTVVSDPIDRVVLSGGLSLTDGLPEAIAKAFGVTVDRLDPFRRIEGTAGTSRDEERRALGARMAVALGLAMRRVGDGRELSR